MARRALDRALLARRPRRAGGRVEGAVAAQVEEAPVPMDDVALAAGDDRAQVVVDALARDPAEPVEDPHVALQKRLERHVEAEVRRLRARVGQRAHQRVDASLATGDLGPARQLRPVELEDLAGAIAGPLGGPDAQRAQPLQAPAHQVDRARVAVVGAQDLGHPRRLDRRPLLEQPKQHRLERIEHRALRPPAVTRRLIALEQPPDGAAIDPEAGGDLALRHPIRPQRPHLRPLQRAPHLPCSLPSRPVEPIEPESSGGRHRPDGWCTFRFPIPVQYWTPGVTPTRVREGVAWRSAPQHPPSLPSLSPASSAPLVRTWSTPAWATTS
jgi:hypothetical protein